MVRTTADNPFVNYQFLKKVLEHFIQHNSIYKRVDHSKHNLPYGMSVEIFRKKLLLKYKNDVSKISKEHVTTKFKKYDDQEIILPNKLKTDYSNLSCTIDTFNDYIKIKEVFSKFSKIDKVCWKKLIHELKKYRFLKKRYLKKSKYIIGGAQIGNNYSNFQRLRIRNLSKPAVIKHFGSIDTAFNYNNSHNEISKINLKKYKFNIMTKLNFSQKNQFSIIIRKIFI